MLKCTIRDNQTASLGKPFNGDRRASNENEQKSRRCRYFINIGACFKKPGLLKDMQTLNYITSIV